MKYIKFLMASAIIMCSGVMSTSAYSCWDIHSNAESIKQTLNKIFPNNDDIPSITCNILQKCVFISADLFHLTPDYIFSHVKLNVKDINSTFELNTNNNISYNGFICHLTNRIETMINDTMQLIKNHIDDYNKTHKIQDNKIILKQRIIQAIGNLYHNVIDITNKFFELVNNNLNTNELIAFNNYVSVRELQNSINVLDNIIQNNNDLRFRIIKYPQMVNQLEILYNELLNGKKHSNGSSSDGIPHDGHGDIIFGSTCFLTKDMYKKIRDFAESFIKNLNMLNIHNNLNQLFHIWGRFYAGLEILTNCLDLFNSPEDIINPTEFWNITINYEDLHQQTNGIFTLNNNVSDKVTFVQVMTYFSNRVGIQLLQVIRNIINELKNNNYLSANDVQNIINQNVQQNIDRIKQVMNALVQSIQNNKELNSNNFVLEQILPKFNDAINDLNKFTVQ